MLNLFLFPQPDRLLHIFNFFIAAEKALRRNKNTQTNMYRVIVLIEFRDLSCFMRKANRRKTKQSVVSFSSCYSFSDTELSWHRRMERSLFYKTLSNEQ